jgi:hypothetical protein
VVTLYAPDGSLVWPGAPAVHGISNIRAAWVDFLKTPGSLGHRMIDELGQARWAER